MNEHVAVVQAYLALSEALETNLEAYLAVFHPTVVQTEYPNLLTKTTQHRSLEAILDNVRAGRELLRNPRFEHSTLQTGAEGSITLETYWQAECMNDFGPMVRGARISAQMCMIFEFQDGLIVRQRSYRCFEPLGA
jgi:ketosteroid isomerase-like protein